MKKRSILKKGFVCMLILAIMLMNSLAVFADGNDIIQQEIVVDQSKSSYDFGFVEVVFNKDSLDTANGPYTFDVSIYAEDGIPYIEFSPSQDNFLKDVKIFVHNSTVTLYDKAAQKDISVELQQHIVKVSHFSRYALQD